MTTKKPTIQPSAWTSVLLAPTIITPESTPPADLRNLLDYLHLQWAANPDAPGPHVVHVMDHYCARSTTTAHRQLSALAKKGFIKLVAHKNDRRKKHIEPTKKTEAYYDHLSHALDAITDPNTRGKVLHCAIFAEKVSGFKLLGGEGVEA